MLLFVDNKWPSKFNCSCSSDNGNKTFDLIADQGSIGCPIQLPPPTTPMLTTSVSTTTQLPTTVEEVTSSMMVAETTEITDIITTISSTTQQSTESLSSPSRQTTSTTVPNLKLSELLNPYRICIGGAWRDPEPALSSKYRPGWIHTIIPDGIGSYCNRQIYRMY